MKQIISATAVMLVIFFQFWPQKAGKSQERMGSVLNITNQQLLKIRDNMLDSIKSKVARTEEKQKSIIIKRKNNTSVKVKTRTVTKTVYVPKVVVKYRTKYVPVPDKEDYWKRQREYTDSLKQAKEDSIKWKHRGIFRKIFGAGKNFRR